MQTGSEADFPLYLFHHGQCDRIYETYGAHLLSRGGEEGALFRVWAPHAKSVSVVGDFNSWDESAHPMTRMIDGESFELFIGGLKEYDLYKFCVTAADGRKLYKCDPVAFHAETPPKTASKLYRLDGFCWSDREYFKALKQRNPYASPMNIYEVNLLSWKRKEDDLLLSYLELREELVPYVRDMGYTHVEFMPVCEFPFEGSWGYQVSGYFAITSRLGTPKDFMALIDAFHAAGIGVILDWVPAHFPKDAFALYEFDGAPLYESAEWDRMEHKSWGTRRFDYGRAEVVSFLISAACFLFDKYHIDGLRVDAVASMLYLDYDKRPGEWKPNRFGENKNLEAIEFLRRLNRAVFARFPYALMIAEESTAWGLVTKPPEVGGLGFSHKWNMGWMNDVLHYMSLDPVLRMNAHNLLTFSMMYAFSENFVLPISHDEVVHGKGSLLQKMYGDYPDKFSAMRAFLGFMFAHPGKKLNFMGYEFAQFKEWNFSEGLEFFLRDTYELHGKMAVYVKELNLFYKSNPPFYQIEDGWQGFEWLAADDRDRNIVAFVRRDAAGREIVAVVSFSGADAADYMLGVNAKGKYRLLFNSDDVRFGGRGVLGGKKTFWGKNYSTHGKRYSLRLPMPRLSCLYLERCEPGKKREEKC